MSAPAYALITGASSGIGECFARALAARRQNVVLVARSAAKLGQLAAEINTAHGILAEAVSLDLSKAGAGLKLADTLKRRELEVNLLINNAGFGGRGEFFRLPLDQQSAMMRLQIETLTDLTYQLVPSMIERRRGAIINVSSMTAFQPIPYAAVYAATKAFMNSFSMALREELRPHGIPVVTLCPGGTRTGFVNIGAAHGRRRFPGNPQPPEEVAAEALQQLDAGGGLAVPRFGNKMSVFAQRFFPREFVAKMVGLMSRPSDVK